MKSTTFTIKTPSACKICKRSDVKHKGNGLCVRCYIRDYKRTVRKTPVDKHRINPVV